MPNIITITLDAETGKLTSAMKGVDQTVKKTKTGTIDFVKTHKAAFLAVSAAIAGATVAMKKIIDSAKTYALEIDKMAKATGLTTQEVARLRFAMEQEHASFQILSTALPILTKNMSMAREGMETYTREFDRMDISVVDATGNLKETSEVLLEMSDFMVGTASDTEKLAVAQTLLGRKGAELIPFLKLGREEIEKLGDEAEQLGLVMGEKEVAAFKKFDDALTSARGALKGVFISIAQQLIPILENFANWAARNMPTIRKVIEITMKVIRTAFAFIGLEIRKQWEVFSWFWDRLVWFFGNMTNIFKESFNFIKEGLGSFADWLTEWAEFALSKLKFWKEEDIQPPPLGEIWQAEFDKVWKPFEEATLEERTAPLSIALQEMLAEIWTTAEEGTEAVVQANQQTFQAAGQQTATMAQKIAENLKKSVADTTTFISNLMLGFTHGTSLALADLIVDGKNFGESMKDVFKGLVKSAIAYIAQLLIIRALTRVLGFPFEAGGEVPGMKAGGRVPKFQAGGEVPIIAHVGEYIIPAEMVRRIRRNRELPLGLLSGILTGSPPRMQAGGMVSPAVDVGGININVSALPEEPTESILDRLSQAVEEGVSSAITFSKQSYNAGQRFSGEAV